MIPCHPCYARLRFCQDYMAAAVAFLDAVGSDQVDGIRGIYLASDDYTVFPEVQKIAPLFFPNVDPARIIWISSRAEMVFDPDDHLRDRDNLATASYQMVRTTQTRGDVECIISHRVDSLMEKSSFAFSAPVRPRTRKLRTILHRMIHMLQSGHR